jgi:hypothetical protein
MANFLGRGESRFSAMLNQARRISNTLSQSEKLRLNEKGTKAVTLLQSKFRGMKAKKELNRMKNKKEERNIALAKEKVSRLKDQHGMSLENFNGQTLRSNKKTQKSRRVRPSPPLRRKPISLNNLKDNALRKTLNRSKDTNENSLQGIRNKLSLKNKMKNMTNSVKRLAYPNRSIPKSRSKTAIEKAMNSTRVFLNRKMSHWITLGNKLKHVKPIVRRVTKLAPK